MRHPVLLATMLAMLAPGCASDCDKICGKLELCQVGCTDTTTCAQRFDRAECLDRCEAGGALPGGQAGSGGGGGVPAGGGSGGGGAAGGGGAPSNGGGSAPARTVKNCAGCVDQAECTDLLRTGICDAVCPSGLTPGAFRTAISNP